MVGFTTENERGKLRNRHSQTWRARKRRKLYFIDMRGVWSDRGGDSGNALTN